MKAKLITEKGYQILQNIVDSEYDSSNGRKVWTFSVTKGMGRSAGGTIAGLSHMGAVTIGKTDNIKTIAITEYGLSALADHKAKLEEATATEPETVA